jgi:hypothetical protein
MAGENWIRCGAGAVALGCIALLAAGSGSRRPAQPQVRAAGAFAASPAGRTVAADYLAIAQAGNQRLDVDFDRLEGRDRNRLAAAKADLRDAASTERLFDRRLMRIAFPPETETVARLLYRLNEARASLTEAAAASTSLRQLHLYQPRLAAANRPVEQAVTTIRRQLGLPPPPDD